MKRIHLRIEDNFLEEIDEVVKMLDTTRSAFLRGAAKMRLRKLKFEEMDHQYAESFKRLPLQSEEMESWSDVQDWGEP